VLPLLLLASHYRPVEPGEQAADATPPNRPEPPAYARPPAITALAYSGDGRLLLVAGYREVLVHDAEPGDGAGADGGPTRPRMRLGGEAERLNALAVSPSGALLAAAGGSPGLSGELQVWDTATWKLARRVPAGKDTLLAAAFSPDGGRIVVGGADRTVRVIDAPTGAEVFAAEVHSDWVTGVAFIDEGKRLVSAGRDRTIRSFEAAGGRAIETVATWDEPVLTLAARPGSGVVVAAGEGRRPVLLDAARGKELRKLEDHPGAVLASAFSRDGSLVAVGGAGDEVRVHDAGDGKRKAALRGAKDWIYALAFSPDGGRLAAAGYEGVVRVYDVKEAKEVRGFIPVLLTTGERRTP
jgi:WD40 repeat protein